MIKLLFLFAILYFATCSFPERILNSFRRAQAACNGNGVLYKGQCFCYAQWTGSQCQIKNNEGYDNNLANTCGNMIVRLDNLDNISPDFYLFDDDVFPRLTYNSIYGNNNLSQNNNWTSLHFVSKNFSIFSKNISALNIGQGALGDCYLLSSYSSLANRNNGTDILNMFHTQTDNPNHVYITRWFIAGKPRFVAVDDWVPGVGTGTWYSQLKENEDVWPLILEKAYAKIFGSYDIINGGNHGPVWSEITFAPTFSQGHDKINSSALFQMIKGFFEKNYLVGSDTPGGTTFTNEVNGHAYAVLGAYTVTLDNGTTVNLIRYMNPWHTEVWKTNPWADNSSVWTPYVISQVPYINANDGIAYSTIDDYKFNFGTTDWAEVNDKYDVSFVDISLEDSTVNVSTAYQTSFTYSGSSSTPLYISIYDYDGRLLRGCSQPFKLNSMFVANPNRQVFSASYGTVKIPNPIQGIYTVYAKVTQVATYINYFTVTAYAPIGFFNFLVSNNDDNLYEKNNCPNDCSFQGSCNYLLGTCTCYLGYTGTDCSNIVNKPCDPSQCSSSFCDTLLGTCLPTGFYNLGKSSFLAMLAGGWGAPMNLSPNFYQYDYNPTTGAIKSKNDGQCVDVYAGSIAYGVDEWGCNGANNQKWILNYTDSTNTTFVIQPTIDLRYAVAATSDGTKVNFAKLNKSDITQQWQIRANKLSCPKNCSNNGFCSISTGKCVCQTGYVGNGCETLELFNCTNNCSGKGVCNHFSGGCQCISGFTGDYCQHVVTRTCPLNCSGNGICLSNGTCSCNSPFVGSNCGQMDPSKNFTLLNIGTRGYLDQSLLLQANIKTVWNFLPDGQLKNLKNSKVIDVYNLNTQTVGPYSLNNPSSTNQEWQVNYLSPNTYIITTQLNMGVSLAYRNATTILTNYSTADLSQQWIIIPCSNSSQGICSS